MNPFTLGTPHHAAWERLATLRIDSPPDLRSIIEEVLVAAQDHFQEKGVELEEDFRRREDDLVSDLDAQKEETISYVEAVESLVADLKNGPMTFGSWIDFFRNIETKTGEMRP